MTAKQVLAPAPAREFSPLSKLCMYAMYNHFVVLGHRFAVLEFVLTLAAVGQFSNIHIRLFFRKHMLNKE
jgi:hypothetical protein